MTDELGLGYDDMNDDWDQLRARWQELFMLLDAVDLKLSPRQAAETLGFQSTEVLHRELQRRGLPVFREVRDWHYVLRLHDLAERDTLARVAFNRDTYPSVLYRFVRRVTRFEWRTIAGLSHAELVAMARRRLEITLR